MAESDSSITKLFIFAVILTGVFGAIVYLMPSEFASPSAAQVEAPSGTWRTAELFLANVTEATNTTLANGAWTAYGFTTLTGDVYYYWDTTIFNIIYFEHRYAGWWIFQNRAPTSPSYVLEDEIIAEFDTVDNSSRFVLSCKHYEYELVFYYNMTAYDNITQALTANDIDCYVAIGDESTASSMSAWSIVSSILFFQSPDIHPVVNAFIAIPLWACVGIVVYSLFIRLLPFVG